MAKNSNVTGRAWRILRLALLWTRRGGVFRRRLLTELRSANKFLKNLGHDTPRSGIYYCQERELSFDKTPIINIKAHFPSSKRFHIPCMTAPQVDFDYEKDDEEETEQEEEQCHNSQCQGIDERAEEFISNFYQQIKLQRQISHLQYQDEII